MVAEVVAAVLTAANDREAGEVERFGALGGQYGQGDPDARDGAHAVGVVDGLGDPDAADDDFVAERVRDAAGGMDDLGVPDAPDAPDAPDDPDGMDGMDGTDGTDVAAAAAAADVDGTR